MLEFLEKSRKNQIKLNKSLLTSVNNTLLIESANAFDMNKNYWKSSKWWDLEVLEQRKNRSSIYPSIQEQPAIRHGGWDLSSKKRYFFLFFFLLPSYPSMNGTWADSKSSWYFISSSFFFFSSSERDLLFFILYLLLYRCFRFRQISS